MVECIVLSDRDVGDLLLSLSREETIEFIGRLESTLKEYSVGNERGYQPDPSYINRPNGYRTLFRPFTSPEGVGVKIIVHPDATSPLHGILVLCNNQGLPIGFINADEVTGYRTTLSAMILYMYRRHTANVVIFGAGKQALWHLRLILRLRGPEIEKITIVNRSSERAQALIKQITDENQRLWKSSAAVDYMGTSSSSYSQDLEVLLAKTDVVFCTTASRAPLFEARCLMSDGNKSAKGCYVSAVGSWQPDMLEVDPALLRSAAEASLVAKSSTDRRWGVIVDDRHESFKNSGEIIQSKLEAAQIAEVGEVLDVLEGSSDGKTYDLKSWLADGLIVYKSVGVSVTDLATGNALLSFAKKRKLGQQLSEF